MGGAGGGRHRRRRAPRRGRLRRAPPAGDRALRRRRGLVLDVSPLGSVAVADGRATIGAGARLGDVYDALDAHGLTIPAGCGPTVGIAGLTLGVGLGILGRLHGLTSDSLRAAQVVLADGRVVDAGEDLLWALRGAGAARFGVVTSLVFETIPAPPATAFELMFAPGDAAALIGAWQDWAPAAPDAIAASLLVNAEGDTLRVRVIGAMAGSEAETTRRLAELAAAAGSGPTSATVRPGPYREAKRFLSGLGEDGDDAGHPYSKSEYFARSLPADAIGRRSSSTPAPPRRGASGSGARGRSRTRSGPAASTRTSPTTTSTTGTPPTTAPTASACSRSSAATTRTTSSGERGHSTADRSRTPSVRRAWSRSRANGCSSACSPSGFASTITTAPPVRSTAAGSA